MRSQQCNRLKERRHFHFDLLQNQLIAVVAEQILCQRQLEWFHQLEDVLWLGLMGVEWGERNCGECRKNKIKNFSAWISPSNAGSKNRGQNHNDILIWRALAIVCMCVRVIRSVRLTSCLISAQNHRQRSLFDLFTAPNCYSALGWLAYTHRHTHTKTDTKTHTHAEQKNESSTELSWKYAKSSVCNIVALHNASSISKHVYSWVQNQRQGPSFFVI